MKLIREEIESVEFIVENRGGKKQLYIEGVFLQGNIKNRNGQIGEINYGIVAAPVTVHQAAIESGDQ